MLTFLVRTSRGIQMLIYVPDTAPTDFFAGWADVRSVDLVNIT